MKPGYLLASVLSFGAIVLAQQSEAWCDEGNGICFQRVVGAHGLIVASTFPRDAGRDEFIGEFVAPAEVKWAGYALGGSMAGNILVMAWPNGGDIVSTTRMAADYTLPAPYSGPTITKLPSSTVNGTHWKFVYRCQGCTKWTSRDGAAGSIADFQVQSWALSTTAVSSLGDPNSGFGQHTDFGTWGQAVSDARTDSYETYLSGSGGGGGGGGGGGSASGSGTASGTGGTVTGTGASTGVSRSVSPTGAISTNPVRSTGTNTARPTGTNSTAVRSTGTNTATSAEGTSSANSVFNYLNLGTAVLLATTALLALGLGNI